MNTLTNLLLPILAAGSMDVKQLLIGFLILVLVLVCIGGLYALIEKFFGPFPAPIRLVVGLVLLILLLIWGINYFA